MTPHAPDTITRLIHHIDTPATLSHGPSVDHVFDPFVFEDEQYFHYYSGATMCWLIRKTLPVTDSALRHHEAGDPQAEAYEALKKFMPPPPPLADTLPEALEDGLTEAAFQGPFWFRELQFLWFFIEETGHWELAVHRMPDPAQAM